MTKIWQKWWKYNLFSGGGDDYILFTPTKIIKGIYTPIHGDRSSSSKEDEQI